MPTKILVRGVTAGADVDGTVPSGVGVGLAAEGDASGSGFSGVRLRRTGRSESSGAGGGALVVLDGSGVGRGVAAGAAEPVEFAESPRDRREGSSTGGVGVGSVFFAVVRGCHF